MCVRVCVYVLHINLQLWTNLRQIPHTYQTGPDLNNRLLLKFIRVGQMHEIWATKCRATIVLEQTMAFGTLTLVAVVPNNAFQKCLSRYNSLSLQRSHYTEKTRAEPLVSL